MSNFIGLVIERLKQVRTLLFSFIEIVPVLLLMIHGTAYGMFILTCYCGFPEWLYKLDAVLRSLFDCSLTLLLLLFAVSKHFRFVSKVSLSCLFGLWVLNTIYLLCECEPDIYFYAFSSIIYVTFVILTVRSLINR